MAGQYAFPYASVMQLVLLSHRPAYHQTGETMLSGCLVTCCGLLTLDKEGEMKIAA